MCINVVWCKRIISDGSSENIHVSERKNECVIRKTLPLVAYRSSSFPDALLTFEDGAARADNAIARRAMKTQDFMMMVKLVR